MWNTKDVNPAPDSWGAVFDASSPYKGKVTAYDSPIYIADAALYLMKTKPDLGIKNPYALDQKQFDAAVALLKTQRTHDRGVLVGLHQGGPGLRDRHSVLGTTWQVIANLVDRPTRRSAVKAIVPSEGSTGWSDTWMIGAKTKHPNCAYKWMDWIISPTVNAQVASGSVRRRPSEGLRRDGHDKSHCATFHAADEAYSDKIWYWTTPTAACLDGRTVKCVPTTRSGRRPGPRSRADDAGRDGGTARSASGAAAATAPVPPATRLRLGPCCPCPRCGWSWPTSARSRPCSPPRSGPRTTSPATWSAPFTTGQLPAPCCTTRSTAPSRCGRVGVAAAVTVIDAVHRAADRVLHGQGRLAAGAAGAGRRGPHPAVGELPGQGLRLAGDARARTASIDWALQPFGLHGPGYGLLATVLTLAYLWLPYMILPIYAGLERLPDSLLEASGDLGAPAGRTFRSVVLPLLFPAIVAGSIFTFSLSLGDYITVQDRRRHDRSCSATSSTTTSSRPTTCRSRRRSRRSRSSIMVVYLFAVRRTGALDNL